MFLLPCEVYHREFDSKLFLAHLLHRRTNQPILIGYDKHFSFLSNYLQRATLLDKSCSYIMWNARIKNVKRMDGSVIVNDEEGINNLDPNHTVCLLNRIDKECANSIDIYGAWGDYDYHFFSKRNTFGNNIRAIGNHRSNMINKWGEEYYDSYSQGLNAVFGEFILCSDNFCIERRDKSYKLPSYNLSRDEYNEMENEYKIRMERQARRRDIFSNYIEAAAKLYPTQNFIIRPHPSADQRWWVNRFWELRNVHIIFDGPIEPWIHACKLTISMGCTVGLQSIIAGTPVIEIETSDNSDMDTHNKGLGYNFTYLIAGSAQQLCDIIGNVLSSPDVNNYFRNTTELNYYWRGSTENINESFASCLEDQAHSTTTRNSTDINLQILEKYSRSKQMRTIKTHNVKWQERKFVDVKTKSLRVQALLNAGETRISKVSRSLYLLQ